MECLRPDVVQLLGQLVATLFGGLLVILANHLTNRRKRIDDYEDRRQSERALLTGMFAVRNHAVETINKIDPLNGAQSLPPLESCLRYVNKLIEKLPAESEAVMISVIEIGLKLDSLVSTIKVGGGLGFHQAVDERTADLMDAFEQYDLMSGSTLGYVSQEDLERMGMPAEPPEDDSKSS